MADGFKTADPAEYHRRFLKENCRPDGRDLLEFRTTTLNIGSISTSEGSALVKIGNTTVICGIKAELAEPPADEPNKGYIVPNVDLPALCASRIRHGPPGDQAQAASQFVAHVIDSADVVLKEDLCIQNGKLCWVLYCDLICLDYDGNLLDGCIIALLAALRNARLPEVVINDETDLPEVNMQKKKPLVIHKRPLGSSFAVLDNTVIIADPTADEEDLATALMTVVVDEQDNLCSFHKPGGTALSMEKQQDCINRAIIRHKEISNMIDCVFSGVKTKDF